MSKATRLRRSASMVAPRRPGKRPCARRRRAISSFAPPGSMANSAIISLKPYCAWPRIATNCGLSPTSAAARRRRAISPTRFCASRRSLTTRRDLYGTYHFAGTGATSWHGFACRIIEAQAQITGRNPRVTAITTADYPTLARRPANSVLDCSLFERTFGFRARRLEQRGRRDHKAVCRQKLNRHRALARGR